MTTNEARSLLYTLLDLYFSGATVKFSSQQNAVKPKDSFVDITVLSTHRPLNPPMEIIDGHPVSFYPTTMNLQVDLYTKGQQVEVGSGMSTPMINTALGDLTGFLNFIGSEYFINWSHLKDIGLTPSGQALDTTILLNKSSYQFRATVELTMAFTEIAVGYSGILDPSSIKHRENSTGDDNSDTYIDPEFTQNSSGGGSDKLAKELIGYFTEAEITQEEYTNEQ